MISMKPSDGFVPNFTSLDFELDRPARMVLAVIGSHGRNESRFNTVSTWELLGHVLDSDNLVFTADGNAIYGLGRYPVSLCWRRQYRRC